MTSFQQFSRWFIILYIVVTATTFLAELFIPITVNGQTFTFLFLLVCTILFGSHLGSCKLTSKMIKKYGPRIEQNPLVRKAYETGDWRRIHSLEILIFLLFAALLIHSICLETVSIWIILPYLYLAIAFLWNFLREMIITKRMEKNES